MRLIDAPPPADERDRPAPLFVSHRGVVYPWHCDHMGHLNNMWYLAKFDEASWAFLAHVGITPAYLRDSGNGLVALEQNTQFKRELVAGDVVEVHSRLIEVGAKILRLTHELRNTETTEIAATCTITAIHLDRAGRKSSPFPDALRAILEARADAACVIRSDTSGSRSP